MDRPASAGLFAFRCAAILPEGSSTSESALAEDDRIAAVLMDLAHARGPSKSFCPSEAARRLAQDWRPLMPEVRRVAATLPLVATQGGRPIDPVAAAGPIRLALDPGGHREN